MSNELAVTENTDLILAAGEDHTGFEEMDSNDYVVPFLTIIQKMSPEADQGVKPGSLYNKTTEDAHESVTFIPCYYQKRHVMWRPRIKGGGYLGQFTSSDPIVINAEYNSELNCKLTTDGNELIETGYFYGLLINADGVPEPMVIAMKSSELKMARRWLTIAKAEKVKTVAGWKSLPLFGNSYTLSTNLESNSKGSWYNWKIRKDARVTDEDIIVTIRQFIEMVVAEKVEVVQAGENDISEDEEEL